MSDINEKTTSYNRPPTSLIVSGRQDTRIIFFLFFSLFFFRESRVNARCLRSSCLRQQWLASRDFMRTLDRIEFYYFRNVSRKSRRRSRSFLHSTLFAETYCDSALTIFIGDGEIICRREKERERLFFRLYIFIEIGGVCGALL